MANDARRSGPHEIWPSLARIGATLAIFVFHARGLLGQRQYHLDFFALVVFSFLSGYLANLIGTARGPWMIRRYTAIMVPYWFVIVPALLANQITGYKPITIGATVVTLLGGNLFLMNPVYVITWYVTFVFLLYVYVLAESFTSAAWERVVVMVVGYLCFKFTVQLHLYFLAFLVGLRTAEVKHALGFAKARAASEAAFGRVLFRLQAYCYPFFLVHGGVQLALLKLGLATLWPLLAASFLIAMVITYFVDSGARPVQRWISAKLLETGVRAPVGSAV